MTVINLLWLIHTLCGQAHESNNILYLQSTCRVFIAIHMHDALGLSNNLTSQVTGLRVREKPCEKPLDEFMGRGKTQTGTMERKLSPSYPIILCRPIPQMVEGWRWGMLVVTDLLVTAYFLLIP